MKQRDVERERHGRRQRRQHRLLAPGPAPAAPGRLRRAPPLPRHRRGRVARAARPRRQTPRVINPKQGFLFNWNNVPSEGWTAGDSEASERNSGRFHRATWLSWLVRDLARDPTCERAPRARSSARARPPSSARWRRGGCGSPSAARPAAPGRCSTRCSRGTARTTRSTRNEHRRPGRRDLGAVQGRGRGDRARPPRLAGVGRAAPRRRHRLVARVRHHQRRGVRAADADARRLPAGGRGDVRQARRAVRDRGHRALARAAQDVRDDRAGRGRDRPTLPFFDRGTWEQLVELGP